MNLPEVLMLKYPSADFLRDIKLGDLGNGPEIIEWNLEGVAQPTDEEIAQFKIDLADEYAAKKVEETRKAQYILNEADTDSLIVALWEKVMENRSTAADALQTKRQAIKAAHPKS